MKKIKTLLMAGTMILSILSLSACGKKEPVVSETTPAPIQVSNEELGRVSEVTTEAPEETSKPVSETTPAPIKEEIVSDKKLVPDCPVTHPDADFSSLTVVFASGEEFKIDVTKGETFGDFLEAFPNKEVRYSRMGNIENETDFFFHGANFEGVFFEFVKDGEVWVKDYGVEYTKDSFADYTIRGLAIYNKRGENKKENYKICEGVGVGYTREEVEAILGEGHVGTNQELPTVMYNDGNTTMVIEYFPFEPTFKFEDTPDIIERVQTIYLIKNN